MLALQDPGFYEYFVPEAKGFITTNLNKGINLVNGRAVEYHSIIPLDKEQRHELHTKLASACPGDVITLKDHPAAVNVILTAEENVDPTTGLADQKAIDAWKEYTVVKDRIVVPILPDRHRRKSTDQSKTVVPGGENYLPSKVHVFAHFPLEMEFVITAHKAEGRTLDRVILALSERHGKGCNMSYAALYVALSRV